MNDRFEAARRRCLATSCSGAHGSPFIPPWFDPLTWRFDAAGHLQGSLPEGVLTEGYRTLVHGGAIAALIDAAMTHCLFGHEVLAVTAELKISYRRPLVSDRRTEISAFIKETIGGCLFRMAALVIQDGETKAEGTASFFRPSDGLFESLSTETARLS